VTEYKTFYALFNTGGTSKVSWLTDTPFLTTDTLCNAQAKLASLSERSLRDRERLGDVVIREQVWELVADWTDVVEGS
jgi:hypothetical protein